MSKKSLSYGVVYLLTACASHPEQAPSPSPADRSGAQASAADTAAVAVSMHVEALSQRERRQYLVRADGTLHTGDGIALFFKVDRPAYTYVAMVPPGGAPTLLYPVGDDRPLQPDVEQRIPKAGDWLYLDDKLGQENLLVIASKRPLADTDPELCRALQAQCVVQASDKPPPPPPPPPGNLDIKTRGRKHKHGTILQAETDAGGVAVLRFSFQHEK